MYEKKVIVSLIKDWRLDLYFALQLNTNLMIKPTRPTGFVVKHLVQNPD